MELTKEEQLLVEFYREGGFIHLNKHGCGTEIQTKEYIMNLWEPYMESEPMFGELAISEWFDIHVNGQIEITAFININH